MAKGKDGKDKGPEAVPVEVMAAAKRPIAASYTGTAPLEARGRIPGDRQDLRRGPAGPGRGRPAGDAGRPWCAWIPPAPRLHAAQTAAQMRKLEANYQRSKTPPNRS